MLLQLRSLLLLFAAGRFLLPFVLGVTVEEIKVESKAIAINAPPGLLH